MTLRPSLLPLRLLLLLLLLSGAVCWAEAGFETESPVRTLQVETLVEPPEPCAEPAAFGDTLHIHYTGSLVDGRIIDTSLTRDPLVIELGQKQVIPGLEQSLLDMCVGEKRRATIPSHLAYGKRGFPPSIPASIRKETVKIISQVIQDKAKQKTTCKRQAYPITSKAVTGHC
ncbi:peptidyl-prolyl cis-trans isomerase FKBP11 isoform X2 [Prionailurus viverrinus]|uniref:peptidyl-prolyl cis-trans isomerase FKBP11 isoform X2 n=1 Tax=Prionailurus viverrinus TaxID=61388 RepID=UPI001FF47358|nr:peptidyl-prolyl cis-trans isomerase FKBP11 isoform X2 [Prionailurus viverrinus]